MSDALVALLARKSELEAAAGPLRERLDRCDAAIRALDEAQQRRDTLLDAHDRATAHAIQYGAHPPDVDPALNLSEIALRKASGEARAAAKAREAIVAELDAITAQQGALALQLEEQTWADADAATAHLFEAVEADTAALRRSLARIQSVSRYAYEQAHSQSNGREPTQHPAFRFWMRNEARLGQVRALGAIEPDYDTGLALLQLVGAGTAPLGDISRWEPPSVMPDGSQYLNRPESGQEVAPQPPEPVLHNPANYPDAAWHERHPEPAWSSPFMPNRQPG
jgi:hypothetical protein